MSLVWLLLGAFLIQMFLLVVLTGAAMDQAEEIKRLVRDLEKRP